MNINRGYKIIAVRKNTFQPTHRQKRKTIYYSPFSDYHCILNIIKLAIETELKTLGDF